MVQGRKMSFLKFRDEIQTFGKVQKLKQYFTQISYFSKKIFLNKRQKKKKKIKLDRFAVTNTNITKTKERIEMNNVKLYD